MFENVRTDAGTAPRLLCPMCNQPLAGSVATCPLCGASTGLAVADDETILPGTLIAGRFRIGSLIDRGKMGAVYRADDLVLQMPVALKFPAAEIMLDPARREQVAEEVRLAGLVTHPNVCRTVDLFEHEGRVFFSMQWVEGRDLKFVLKSCRRFPEKRGLEIARQICDGLEAIHQAGLIHRDLKPSNILVDGDGHVRLTDFGIASVAGAISNPRTGTLAYMAPEQIAGGEITHRTDVYTLGVVLYELFTGTSPFAGKSVDDIKKLQAEGTLPAPSSVVPGIDARIERVILKCLEEDPHKRPPSAGAVSAALLGEHGLTVRKIVDPQPIDPLPLRRVVPIAMGTLAGFAAVWILSARLEVVNRVPLENSPDVLAARARDIARSLGYRDRSSTTASGFRYEDGLLTYFRGHTHGAAVAGDWPAIVAAAPTPVTFWLEENVGPLAWSFFVLPARLTDLFPIPTGTVSVEVDPAGRLTRFSAWPTPADTSAPMDAGMNWSIPFGLAGLDIGRFTDTGPRPRVGVLADAWSSWTGRYSNGLSLPVRIDAASYLGKVTYFEIVFPWTESRRPAVEPDPGWLVVSAWLLLSLVACAAWYHCVSDTADLRGTWRVGLVVFLASLGSLLFHASYLTLELAVTAAVFDAVVASTAYLAFEPWVRRHWPEAASAWQKVLAGGWDEVIVGRDILIGACAASIGLVVRRTVHLAAVRLGAEPSIPAAGLFGFAIENLGGWTSVASEVMTSILMSGQVLLFFLIFCVVRRFVSNARAASVLTLVALLLLVMPIHVARDNWLVGIDVLVDFAIMVAIMSRYGVFAAVVFGALSLIFNRSALTTDLRAWYGHSTVAALAVASIVTVASAWIAAGCPEFWRVARVSREP